MSAPAQAPAQAAGLAVVVALAIVYVVWGSTYLAIRFALEGGWPPLLKWSPRGRVSPFLPHPEGGAGDVVARGRARSRG